MRSRVEDYYRRGLEAQQHAAQVAEPRLKKAFEEAADNWFTLASGSSTHAGLNPGRNEWFALAAFRAAQG